MATKSIDEILADLEKNKPPTQPFNKNYLGGPSAEQIRGGPLPLMKDATAGQQPLTLLKPFDSKLSSSGDATSRATLMLKRIEQKPPSLRSPDDNELFFILNDYLKLLKVKAIDMTKKGTR